jgi:hypothetical protein
MKKTSVWLATLAVAMSAVAAISFSDRSSQPNDNVRAVNAAYRDGAYRGRLAVSRGEKAQLMTTRWTPASERAAFAAGYDESYRGEQAANGNDALQAAYRDGLYIGKLHADQGRNARVATSRWSTEKDRTAFANGYVEGYRLVASAKDRNPENALLIERK